MLKIEQLTSDSLQKQNLILPDGTIVTLTIEFKPMQLGWFIRELVYGEFVLNGVRIVTSPNILYQFKNKIPFGLACFTQGNSEPTLQEDFSINGRSTLYLLTEEEVEELAGIIRGQAGA